MVTIYIYSILSVVIISLVSFVGVLTLTLRENLLKKYIFLLVSLAVGALLGDAFIHLIPEAFESAGSSVSSSVGNLLGSGPTGIAIYIIAGILVFFIIEKFLHWHHHELAGDEHVENPAIHPTGKLILISDGVHNFIDGLIIGASYLVSVEVGIATTLAVVLHEIPQEIGDFGVLIHAGYSRAKALWFNFLSAIMAVVGVVISLLIGSRSETLTTWLIPLAAGGFIYIALSDLIPELHKTKNWKHSFLQLFVVILGVGAMVGLLALE